jgi:hypothetical protein
MVLDFLQLLLQSLSILPVIRTGVKVAHEKQVELLFFFVMELAGFIRSHFSNVPASFKRFRRTFFRFLNGIRRRSP